MKDRPKLAPLMVANTIEMSNYPQTAPVMEGERAVQDLRLAIEESATRSSVGRTYSLSQSRPRRGSEAHHTRPKLNRQKTLSGDSNSSTFSPFGSNIFMRAFSRNPDVQSIESGSVPAEEWRRLFDRYDKEHNGRVDGKIPVKDFEKVLPLNHA